jgi:hypothetical protein
MNDERAVALSEGMLRPCFGDRVEVAGRLVEDDDLSQGQEDPGEGDELAFPRGDSATARRDLGTVASQTEDRLVQADGRHGVRDIGFGRLWPQVGEVLPDRSGENVGLLGDERYAAP